MRSFLTPPLFAAAVLLSATTVQGHPIPDIPVRSHFASDGSCVIGVEVDLRCFSDDPLNEPYLLNWVLQEMDPSEKEDLVAKAGALIRDAVAFRFEPSGALHPEFVFDFTGKEGALLEKIEDPVMLTGSWAASTPGGVKGYQVEALAGGRYDLQFLNWLDGTKVERMQVLFPEEKSFVLDLSGLNSSTPNPSASPAASARDANYLPILLITAVVAGAVVGMRWARRNRST